jgi:uncharacterized repeat protein (TIGR01451 family)
MRRTGRRATATAASVLAASALVATIATAPAAVAAPGDAVPELTDKNVDVTEAEGGDLVTYTITFTCSNSQGGADPDGCDGTQFSDPLPTFTDVYGNTVPVELVSATGPASVFPDGFTLDTSDPANPAVVGTAGTWPAGTSGVISVTVRVPSGTVPVEPQVIENTATITDPDDDGTDDSTTASTTIAGTEPDWTVSKLGPGEDLRLNHQYGWVVSVCTDDPASAAWPIYDITDTVPAGFEYLGSDPEGTYTDDGTPADTTSDGAATVTWHFDADNPPPLGDDGCFRLDVTGEFPSDHPTNTEGARKTNTASGTGSNTPDDPGTDLGEDTTTGTILGPQFGGVGVDKRVADLAGGDDFFVAAGDQVRFDLSLDVDSDFLLDRVVLEDGAWAFDDGSSTSSGTGMPESFTASEVVPGTWNDPVTASIEGSDDGTTWSAIASGVTSGAPSIALSPTFRSVRWVWESPGDIRGDFAASGQQIVGVVGEPEDAFGRYTDIATTTVERADADPATASADDDYVLETPQPHPGVTKSVDQATRQPGQTAVYSIVVDNDPDATGELVDPSVADCIPEFFVLQGAPVTGPGWVDGPVIACGPGETSLSFQYEGALGPGESTSAITYSVLVAGSDPGPPAPYGGYTNTAFVRPAGGDGEFGHCQNLDPPCGSAVTVTVPPTVELQSSKCVSGELDDGTFRPTPACDGAEPAVVAARTFPGGTIDYRLTLTNVGNTDATDIDFVDLLPHVGDTAVITGDPLNPRGSELRPLLLSLITAPPGWTVAYSTASDPCRPEVGGPTTGCSDPEWTTSPDPLALASYRSLRFSFDGLLERGDAGVFAWRMRAPAASPSYDQGGTSSIDPWEFLRVCDDDAPEADPSHCPRAVNSFAYGADAGGLPDGVPAPGRLFAEPPEVEVRVIGPGPSNAIGDRVWEDRDFDGIQDDGEPGVPGIGVELRTTDDVLLAQAFTDDEGRYLFGTLDGAIPIPDGTYVLRFYPEPGWYVPPQDATGGADDEGSPFGPLAGTNTGDDSDAPRTPSGTDPVLGPYHETVPVTLGDNPNLLVGAQGESEIDPTWDLGLWRADPGVEIDKVTKDSAWPDTGYGDGVAILPDRPVTWRYTVANTGNTRLEDVVVTDDAGTPGDTFDDVVVDDCTLTEAGENADGLVSSDTAPMALNRGAAMVCTSSGTSALGTYGNVADVAGTPVTDGGDEVTTAPPGYPPLVTPVIDSDPSSYVNAVYDLALAKVVGAPDLATGEVTFTITIANQGTVASGAYTVTDALPPGLSLMSTTPAATSTGGTPATGVVLAWELDDLAPGAEETIAIDAHIDDYLVRPYRNLAEISADSAALVETGGVSTPTMDVDSTPDADPANDGDYGPVGDPTDVDNQAIGDAGLEPDPEDDADIADLDPDITYDLALAKVEVSSPIGLGETPAFTIRVYNQGNVPSGPFTIADQLPTGLSFDAAASSAGCEARPGNQVRCANDGIQPGTSATFTIATTIDGTPHDWSTAPWQNWAEIATDSAQALYAVDDVDSTPEDDDPNGVGADGTPPGDPFVDVTTAGENYATPAGDDEDDNDTAVVASSVRYDLALAKSAAATPVTQTEDATITYTITVENQGTVASGAYDVTDVVPTGIVVTDAGGAMTTPNPDGSTTLVFTGNSLDPGDLATFTIQTTVTDLTVRPYRNVAEISDDAALELYGLADDDSTPDTDPGNDGDYGPVGDPSDVDNVSIGDAGVDPDPEDDADIADVTFPLSYDLALANLTGAATVEPDGTIDYDIVVQNQGVVDARGFTVVDRVAPGLVVVPGSISDDGALAPDGSTITWALDGLEPAASHTFTFSAVVDDLTLRPFRNQAEITADGADEYTVPGDSISDDDSTPDTDPGNDGDYGPVGNPSGVDNLSISDAGVDPDPEDDADIADVDVDVRYDLALIKTGPAHMAPTGEVTFTVTVANQGNVPSGAYTVEDLVPSGLVVVDADPPAAIAPDSTELAWEDLPSLNPGETAALSVSMRADSIPDGLTERPFTNRAEIAVDDAASYSSTTETTVDGDSVPDDDATSDADNRFLVEAGVGADAGFDDEDVAVVDSEIVYDLALSKLVDDEEIAFDGEATFTIVVANQGNVPSGPATVTDVVPIGLTPGEIGQGGVLADDGVTITWVVELDPGEQVELTFDVTVGDITTRPWTNVAAVTSDSASAYSSADDDVVDADSVPGDEASSDADDGSIDDAGGPGDEAFDDEDVAVLATTVVYDLAIDKRLIPGQVFAVNSDVSYEVEVTNQGTVPSGSYTFTDTIPPGMAFASASDGGTASGQVVTWADMPSLDPGASSTVTVQATLVDGSYGEYRNWVEITADSAAAYSAPGDEIADVDSVPGDGERGEDDDDAEVLTLDGDVGGDSLSRTGAALGGALLAALVLVGAGSMVVRDARRRSAAA